MSYGGVHVKSAATFTMESLLDYITGRGWNMPPTKERQEAGKRILADFYFNCNLEAAQKTIDYYSFLNGEEVEQSFKP